MAITAFQTIYRPEYIAVFERSQSNLRATTVTEANVNGNQAVFLTAGSGGASAVTRGANGFIPARNNSLTQNTAVLTEWHDLPQATSFTTDLSQGDIRRIMQETSVKVINRKIDDQIIAELNTATLDTGAATTANLALVTKSLAILGQNDVNTDEEDSMFGVVTPAFMAYLMQTPEFASADYVEVKPFVGPVKKFRRWAGVNWITHTGLPGMGTNAEKCFLYHKNSLGHAANTAEMKVNAGYNEEQDYYFARASMFMGAKLLQNNGIIVMNHDGSAMVAS